MNKKELLDYLSDVHPTGDGNHEDLDDLDARERKINEKQRG